MIGKFAALSVADTANISSFYNGKKYSYIMYKNGTGINIDKLGETVTDLSNGVEVSVTISWDKMLKLQDALRALYFFTKLHVVTNNSGSIYGKSIQKIAEKFNNRTVKELTYFCGINHLDYQHGYSNVSILRIGNVIYPYNTDDDFINESDCILKFDVGELDITPNREQLQYTQRTNEAIARKIQLAKQEYMEYLNTNPPAFNAAGFEASAFQVILGQVSKKSYLYLWEELNVRASIENIIESECLLVDGERIPLKAFEDVYKVKSRNFDKKYLDFYTRKGTDFSAYGGISFITRKIYIQKEPRLKNSTKLYYDSLNNSSYIVIKNPKKFIRTLYSWGISKSSLHFYLKHAHIEEITNSSVPQTFIDSITVKSSAKVAQPNCISVRVYDSDGSYHKETRLLNHVLTPNETVIYGTHTKADEEYRQLGRILEKCQYIAMWTLPKEVIPIVENNRNFISFEQFTAGYNKILSRWVTANIMRKEFFLKYKGNSYYSYDSPLPDKSKEFYQNYQKKWHGDGYSTTLGANIQKKYTDNKWLDYSALESFRPSEKDMRANLIYSQLKLNYKTVCQEYLWRHYKLKSFDLEEMQNNLAELKKRIHEKLNEYESN